MLSSSWQEEDNVTFGELKQRGIGYCGAGESCVRFCRSCSVDKLLTVTMFCLMY